MHVKINIPVNDVYFNRRLPLGLRVLILIVQLLKGVRSSPILVEPLPNKIYKLISGHHQLSAYLLLNRSTIPAMMKIAEEPNPYTDLRYNGKLGRAPIPQTQERDGFSLNERETNHE